MLLKTRGWILMIKFKSMQSRLTTIFIGISFLTMLFLGCNGIYGAVQENARVMAEFRKDMERNAELQIEWQTQSALSVVENCYQAQMRGELTEEQAAVNSQLEEKMERWVYLTDLAEKIAAQE